MSAAIDTKEKTGYESPMYAGVNGSDGKNAAVVNGKSGSAMDGQNGDVSANDNQDGGKEKGKKKKEEKPPQVSVMQVVSFIFLVCLTLSSLNSPVFIHCKPRIAVAILDS